MIKRKNLPTIIGLVILVASTLAGIFLVSYKQIFRIGATGEDEPNNIRVSNITGSSLTISWTTDGLTSGFVSWDRGVTSPDENGYTHLVTLSGLEPNTTYDYKISSNGKMHDNNGIPWRATTSQGQQPPGTPELISGSVLTATGQAVRRALVYVSADGVTLSTLTSNSGNYVFQIPVTDPARTLLEILVQAGPQGISSAQIYPQSAKPVPPIILGTTHDFRSLPPSRTGDIPGANLNLPDDPSSRSRFSIPQSGTPLSSAGVTLESVDEGELVTSTQPEFFGDGPAGTSLTITVESETPISGSVSVAANGSWSWNPPDNLAPGTHKVTITWKDISGITRTLTRNFIVQAGEAPAFEASSSGQTATPTPATSPRPTSTPRITPTALATPIPETGSLTPTLLLSIMGIAVMAFSFYIWKNAQSI